MKNHGIHMGLLKSVTTYFLYLNFFNVTMLQGFYSPYTSPYEKNKVFFKGVLSFLDNLSMSSTYVPSFFFSYESSITKEEEKDYLKKKENLLKSKKKEILFYAKKINLNYVQSLLFLWRKKYLLEENDIYQWKKDYNFFSIYKALERDSLGDYRDYLEGIKGGYFLKSYDRLKVKEYALFKEPFFKNAKKWSRFFLAAYFLKHYYFQLYGEISEQHHHIKRFFQEIYKVNKSISVFHLMEEWKILEKKVKKYVEKILDLEQDYPPAFPIFMMYDLYVNKSQHKNSYKKKNQQEEKNEFSLFAHLIPYAASLKQKEFYPKIGTFRFYR